MNQPIRIAQIMGRMERGGVEAVVMNYYRHVDRSRVQFDFFLDETSTFPQRTELERLGAGIHLLPPYSHPAAYRRALVQLLAAGGYPIVHAHTSTMAVFALSAAQKAGVPVRIVHNHSTAAWGEGKKTWMKLALRPFAKTFATDYFACGEQAGRWMYGDACFDAGRVHVLPNAVDTARFAFDPAARASLRASLGLGLDAFVVGHVGRFMYQKNHAFLLAAFAALHQKQPAARLLLVGEGELMDDMRVYAAELGLTEAVVFTGPRQDVDKLYSAMDVFCLPSFYEGLPVVGVEAQANGLPCVFSDQMTKEALLTPAARMLPLQTGADGWADALAAARRFVPAAGALDGFDIEKTALQLQHFYEERVGML